MGKSIKEKLKKLTDEQLIDVVVNYKTYHYPEDAHNIALKILQKRNISQEKLELLAERYEVDKQDREQKKEELTVLRADYIRFMILTYISAFVQYAVIIVLNMFLSLVSGPVALLLTTAILIMNYIFYALAMNKYIIFRSVCDDLDVNLLSNIFYFSVGFGVSPIVLLYNLVQMNRAIKRAGQE